MCGYPGRSIQYSVDIAKFIWDRKFAFKIPFGQHAPNRKDYKRIVILNCEDDLRLYPFCLRYAQSGDGDAFLPG